jgi:hypothetical protein
LCLHLSLVSCCPRQMKHRLLVINKWTELLKCHLEYFCHPCNHLDAWKQGKDCLFSNVNENKWSSLQEKSLLGYFIETIGWTKANIDKYWLNKKYLSFLPYIITLWRDNSFSSFRMKIALWYPYQDYFQNCCALQDTIQK